MGDMPYSIPNSERPCHGTWKTPSIDRQLIIHCRRVTDPIEDNYS